MSLDASVGSIYAQFEFNGMSLRDILHEEKQLFSILNTLNTPDKAERIVSVLHI